MGAHEVLDAERLVREYVSPRKRGLRYAYPYYDGLITNGDPTRLCTGDLLAPTLLGVHVDPDRMHTLTALMPLLQDRKSTRLNSSHANISYAVFCLKKKKNTK